METFICKEGDLVRYFRRSFFHVLATQYSTCEGRSCKGSSCVLLCGYWLILRRVQAAGAGAEGDVGAVRIVRQRLRAVPDTRTAMDAFLAVEIRHASITERDGLAAAGLD